MPPPPTAAANCRSCDQPNPAGARFCGHCGERLALQCEGCGTLHPVEFRFCGHCGRSLTGPRAAPEAAAPPPPAVEAERRAVTLLFCDIVDSVGLSSGCDPEEYGALILAYREACTAEVEAAGGRIAQYAGDGVLAHFGYPVAHEDDPVRAVRAGLGILRAMEGVNRRLAEEGCRPLAVRAAVHAGLVVAGDLGTGAARESMAVVGEATNVAARLQQAAAPNSLVVSDPICRAIRGYFECRPLGPQQLRGLHQAVMAHMVVASTGAASRMEARPALLPLVGRRAELTILRRLWGQAARGAGRAVLLRGEAGLGKSRLVQELRASIAAEEPTVILCQCLAEHQTSSLQPVAAALRRLYGLSPEAGPEAVRAHLREDAPPDLSAAERETLAAGLADVLLPPAPEGDAATDATLAQRRRQRSFAAVADCIALRAARRPVLLVVEDLHWADDSTLSLLDLLLERIPAAAVLAVLTVRPEFEDACLSHPAVVPLELHRLAAEDTAAMVGALAGGKALPPALLRQIVEQTEGVPLFVEELTSTVLDSDGLRECEDRYELAGSLQPLALPTTLQGSLMARLDRLGPAKPVAQLSAAIGRSFSREMVEAVSGLPRVAVAEALDRLTAERFLFRRGATYTFRHALIQEAAYQSVLLVRRRAIHGRIAEVLRDGLAGEAAAETPPELIANHLTLAGMTPAAARAWEQAGRAAAARSANAEAAGHFQRALELLEALPPSEARSQRMLDLRMALGTQYLVTRGNGAPEVQAAFDGALALTEGIAGTPATFRALYGLQTFYIVRGQLAVAEEIGRRLLDLAGALGQPGLQVQAHRLAGLVAFYGGRFAAAQAELERAAALYSAERDAAQRFEFGSDPGTLTQCHLGWVLWFRGEPEAALVADARALDLAAGLAHPHSRAFALSFSASLRQSRGEPAEARRQAEAVVALAREHGFRYWEAWGDIVGGWSLVALGEGEAGLACLRRGLTEYEETGGGLIQPYGLMLLADAQLRLGDAGSAAELAAAGLAEAERTGVRFVEAELHRLRGEALLRRDGDAPPEALAALERAAAVAAGQDAPMPALRALTALVAALEPDGARRGALASRLARLRADHPCLPDADPVS